jgi:hypothetical protein
LSPIGEPPARGPLFRLVGDHSDVAAVIVVSLYWPRPSSRLDNVLLILIREDVWAPVRAPLSMAAPHQLDTEVDGPSFAEHERAR